MKGRSRSLKPVQHEGDGRRAGDPRFSPIQEAAFLTERQQKVLDLLTAEGVWGLRGPRTKKGKAILQVGFSREDKWVSNGCDQKWI